MFYPEVLNEPFSPVEGEVKQLREDLQSGISIEQAREELLDAGLSKGEADQFINRAVAGKRSRCPACKISFVASVTRCTTCRGETRQN